MSAEENRLAALALIRGIIGDATIMAEAAQSLERKPDEAPPPAKAVAAKPVKAEPVKPVKAAMPPKAEPAKASSQSEVMALIKKAPR